LDDYREGQPFTCNQLLSQSSAINLHHFFGEKGVFQCILPSRTRSKKGSFKLATSLAIVLAAMTERNKPLLDTILCFSLSQTNFTTSAKTAPFHRFFDVQRPNGEEGGIFWGCCEFADCTLGVDRHKQAFTWYSYCPNHLIFTLPVFGAKMAIFPRKVSQNYHEALTFHTRQQWVYCT